MIAENVKHLMAELPAGVELSAAAKTRSAEEILEAAEAGIRIFGENYVQEARDVFRIIGRRVKWHFIGHLQRNKVKAAVEIFDMIETVDSEELASEIDKRCAQKNIRMPVLIEVNSGREDQKSGVWPERVEPLAQRIKDFPHIRIKGLMTMGPFAGDPENARPYFQETSRLFDRLKSLNLPDVDMTVLSMGMSNSYRVAIEEGATLIRLGTRIFGPR